MASQSADIHLRLKADIKDVKHKLDQLVKSSGQTASGIKKTFAGASAGLAKFGLAVQGIQTAFRMAAAPVGRLIDLADQQLRVNKQLETVISSTGNAAGVTAHGMKQLADDLQDVTTFGNETIQTGQNILLTFKKIGGDIMPRVNETMLDVATAMDQGLKETAIQLGKALNDPIEGLTALRRVGITFTDAQEEAIKKMVEMNDIAAAQRMILDELESQFGGSARAAADVWTGGLVQAKNAIGDAGEALANLFGPAVAKVAGLMKTAAEKATAFFKGLTGTSLADTIAELKEYGAETLDLELVLARVEAARLERLAASLGTADEAQERYQERLEETKTAVNALGDAQIAVIEEWGSEATLRVVVGSYMAAATAAGTMATAEEERAMAALSNLETFEQAAKAARDNLSIAQEEVTLVTQKGAALREVAALEDMVARGGKQRRQEEADQYQLRADGHADAMSQIYELIAAEERAAAIRKRNADNWREYQYETNRITWAQYKAHLENRLAAMSQETEEEKLLYLQLQDKITALDEKTRAKQLAGWTEYTEGLRERFRQLQYGFRMALEEMSVQLIAHKGTWEEQWVQLRDRMIDATTRWVVHEIGEHIAMELAKTTATAEGAAAREGIKASEVAFAIGGYMLEGAQYLIVEAKKTAAAIAGALKRMAIKSKEVILDIWSMLVKIAQALWSLGPWALVAIPAAIAGTMALLTAFLNQAKSIRLFAKGGLVERATVGVIGEGGEPELVTPMSVLNRAFDKRLGGMAQMTTKLDELIDVVKRHEVIIRGGDLVSLYAGFNRLKVRNAL